MSTLSTVACVPLSPALGTSPPANGGRATRTAYGFFNAREATFIEPACERLISSESVGTDGAGCNLAHYLDRQLSGAWGAGESLFREGAWQPGTEPNVPAPFTPAILFRRALGAINLLFEQRSTAFSALSAEAQNRFLARLQTGGLELDGAPARVFFDLLLRMTVEGLFSNPLHGATRDRVAWRLAGFPGAHAAPVTARIQSSP